MKKRPKILTGLALYLCAIALGLPVQIMLLYGHPPYELTQILTKLPPLNLSIMVMAPLVAWLVYRASPLALPAIPMLAYLVIMNNWFVAEVGTDYSSLAAGLATGAFLVSLSVVLQKPVLQLLLNPNNRWWLTPTRRRVQMPVMLGNDGLEIVASTFDISESGAFIPLWPIRARDPRSYLSSLQPGKTVTIFLDLKSSARIQCQAEVVRHAKARGGYPDGIGLRFLDLSWADRRRLAQFAESAGSGNGGATGNGGAGTHTAAAA